MRFRVFAVLSFAVLVALAGTGVPQAQSVLEAPYSISRFRLGDFSTPILHRNETASGSLEIFFVVPQFQVPEGKERQFLTEMVDNYWRGLAVVPGSGTAPVGIVSSANSVVLSANNTTMESIKTHSELVWNVESFGDVQVLGEEVAAQDGVSLSLFYQAVPVRVVHRSDTNADPSSITRASNAISLQYRVFDNTKLGALIGGFAGLLAAWVYFYLRTIRRIRDRGRASLRLQELQTRLEKAELRAERLTDQPERQSTSIPPLDVPRPPVPPALLDALADKTAMVAFGSGASAQAGLPTSHELILRLVDRFDTQISDRLRQNIQYATSANEEGVVEPDRFSAIVEALSDQVSRPALIEAVQDIFADMRRNTGFYETLSRIGWSGALSLVWDDMADENFLAANPPFLRLNPEDTDEMRQAIKAGEKLLLRGWGGLTEASGENIVLTFEEFRKLLEERPEFGRQLTLLLQTRTFLFLGLSPISLREYLTALNPYLEVTQGRHFALVPASYENELFVRPLEQYGIELLEYDPAGDHAQVKNFIDDLLQQARNLGQYRQPEEDRANPLAWQPLTRLELENIGPFNTLEIDLPTGRIPNDTAEVHGEPWTIITGENGMGKTVILRAIALALSASDPLVAARAGSLLKLGKQSGRVTLSVGTRKIEVRLVRDRKVIVTSRQISPLAAGQFLVLGFPALRGAPSGEPAGPRELDEQPPGPQDVYPLVLGSVDDRMLNLKQWIVNVLSAARGGDAKNRRLAETLDSIVSQIMPGGVVGFAPLSEANVLKLSIRTPGDGGVEREVPFEQLSQGMSAIFNWVGVLLQRLHDISGEDEDPSKVAATVIVDEIDVHLHPEWQRRVVTLVKDIFPNVQVIASTHSALIVSSVTADEVRIFRRIDDGEFQLVRPTRETYGRSATDLMQGEALGVQNARTVDFDEKVVEYLDLRKLASRNPDQEDRYQDLRSELQDANWAGISEEPAPVVTAEDIQRLSQKYF